MGAFFIKLLVIVAVFFSPSSHNFCIGRRESRVLKGWFCDPKLGVTLL